MPVPQQVQDQADKADQLHAELYGKTEESAPVTKEDEEQKPVETEPVKPAEHPKPDSDADHKYKVLKGKYDKEVPQLQAMNRDLQRQLQAVNANNQSLTDLLKDLKGQITEPKVPAKDEGDLDMESLAEYGEDFVKLAKKLDAVVAENARLKEDLGQVKTTQVQTDKEKFYARLYATVPAIEKLNTDAGFLNWLDEVHPFTGEKRIVAFRGAEKAGNIARLKAIVDDYLGSTGQMAKPTPKPKPDRNMESAVAPDRSAAQTPESPDKRVWTGGEIKAFYKKQAIGGYTDDEAAKIENQIMLAQKEGRIKN